MKIDFIIPYIKRKGYKQQTMKRKWKNLLLLRTIVTAILMTAMAIGSLSGCGSASENVTDAMLQTDMAENELAEKAEEAARESEAAAKESEEAARESEEAAKEAEANEYYEKGRASLYGLDGNEINMESAYAAFKKAKELGKQEANLYLGLMYDWYSYPEQNCEMAKTYYEACDDNLYAQISLARNE